MPISSNHLLTSWHVSTRKEKEVECIQIIVKHLTYKIYSLGNKISCIYIYACIFFLNVNLHTISVKLRKIQLPLRVLLYMYSLSFDNINFLLWFIVRV